MRHTSPIFAVLLGPQPDRVSTHRGDVLIHTVRRKALPDGLSVSDKAADVIVKQDTVAAQQS